MVRCVIIALLQQFISITAAASNVERVSSLIASARSYHESNRSNSNTKKTYHHRLLDEIKKDETCDKGLSGCLSQSQCTECFKNMLENNIDFSMIADGTECKDVVDSLVGDRNICDAALKTDTSAYDAFCNAFQNCAVTNNKYYDDEAGLYDDVEIIDCDSLEACEWEGFQESYIGDGICHEWYEGCYNHKICGYDGGDCCADTCKTEESKWINCGDDGFFCRNPESAECDEFCNSEQDASDGESDPEELPDVCDEGETMYKLMLFSSFGSGWDSAQMTIRLKDSTETKPVYEGTLDDGFNGKHFICLKNDSSCYAAELTGGTWGNKASWQINPMAEGAPDIARGGSPVNCEFPVGPDTCEKTCNGQSDEAPSNDEDDDRQTYKIMSECIESKCVIQLDTCQNDRACNLCMDEDAPAYCYGNSNFNALITCTLCNCMEEGKEGGNVYCQDMPRDGSKAEPSSTGQMPQCNAFQVRNGVSAVLEFHECSGISSDAELETNFDNEKFGMLDAFESCATTYRTEDFHGGKKALDCMRILEQAIEEPTKNDDEPSEVISDLAVHLYENGVDFCDCSVLTSRACPVCKDFVHFKTLLFESVDACRALDDIDCDAWAEFHADCEGNLDEKYGLNSYFKTAEQCNYVRSGCGNVGPFPSFRNIDCEKEISSEAWSFYRNFEAGCVSNDNGNEPPKKPSDRIPSGPDRKANPVPVQPPKWNINLSPSPTKVYIPQFNDDFAELPTEKVKRGMSGFWKFVFFCIICGSGYWWYKNRRSEFDYMRFRRTRNFAPQMGLNEQFTMENSTSFEPPSLPPPPSAYESNNVA